MILWLQGGGRFCTKCKVWKFWQFYYKDRRAFTGFGCCCKKCTRKAVDRYKAENPEKVWETDANYRRNNIEKIREKDANYRRNNIEKVRKTAREASAKYRQNNIEKVRERSAEYRRDNREKVLDSKVKYRQNNADIIRESDRKRRALKKSTADGTITVQSWANRVQEYGGRCYYCGCLPDSLHQDHFMPLSKGGEHTITNVVPACGPCNLSKSDMLPLDYLSQLEKVAA